jgi:hypothetical protein
VTSARVWPPRSGSARASTGADSISSVRSGTASWCALPSATTPSAAASSGPGSIGGTMSSLLAEPQSLGAGAGAGSASDSITRGADSAPAIGGGTVIRRMAEARRPRSTGGTSSASLRGRPGNAVSSAASSSACGGTGVVGSPITRAVGPPPTLGGGVAPTMEIVREVAGPMGGSDALRMRAWVGRGARRGSSTRGPPSAIACAAERVAAASSARSPIGPNATLKSFTYGGIDAASSDSRCRSSMRHASSRCRSPSPSTSTNTSALGS